MDMSRLSRYLWQVCAPVLLAAGSLTAQNFLYVPTESSVPPQLRVYGIQAFNGQTFNYATQNLNGNLANVVAVTPNGRFMYVGEGDGTIDAFVVNPDGTLSSVGAPFANAGSVRGLAINTAGAFLYASDNAAGAIRVFSIDQTT